MNREIKFRVFDEDNNKVFCFIDVKNQLLNTIETLTSIEDYFGGGYFERNPNYLMQYTGLKDSKGIEIYEGDIFRQEIEEDRGDIRNYLVVMWIKQRAAFYLIPVEHMNVLENNNCEEEKEFSWLFEHASLYDFNIYTKLPLVGNVYQNPELLNTK